MEIAACFSSSAGFAAKCGCLYDHIPLHAHIQINGYGSFLGFRGSSRVSRAVVAGGSASASAKKLTVNGYAGPSSSTSRLTYTWTDSCLVIPPPAGKKPRAIIKFLGGAFIGAVPELTYSYLTELLAKDGFLVISVPYNVTFDHVQAARQVYERFNGCLDNILASGLPNSNLSAAQLAQLPVFSVGHSNGALLQVLAGSYFSDKVPMANVIIAYNNRPATEAVPYFEQKHLQFLQWQGLPQIAKAEKMTDGIISMLLDRLASTVYEYVDGQVKLVLDAKKDVEEFADNLRAIQAVLEDAEQRQVKDASARIWLDQLKDISLQMVDMLDEWNTDMLRQQVEKQEREGENAHVPEKKKKKKKVTLSVSPSCFCIPKAKEVIFCSNVASKIKYLNDKLSVIDEQRKRYGFQHIERGIQELPERQKTSSFVVVSEVFGREKEKDILITKLLSDRRGLLIIPILGMGGMGKTTLAQLVYNDDKVKAYFEKRVWVCVSDPYDEIKIAKAICGDNAPNSNELDHVLQRMSTTIEGKRFLLVLDDVWTHNRKKWEKLRAALIQSGAHGSRILVTTRQHDVVDVMRASSDMINLGELSEECCLLIFNHMSFADTEVEESKAFEDISKDIVKKCKGLPLAAKALGGLMYNKKTRREWLDVLNSKVWDQEEMEQEVFQPLFLSYYDLAPVVKCCLLYCASFPKDHEFKRDRLINLWMAQDYLNSKGNKDEGEIGRAIFDTLVARSFFQDLKKNSVSGQVTSCKMHDVVHDFVQSLTKNECLIIDVEGVDNEIEALGEKVRHLTLTLRSNRGKPLPPSNTYYNCKNLRSLTTISYSYFGFIAKIDSNFILQLKCLRTLNLSGNGISEVPKEIGELIHLRHIDLSRNEDLKILPDSFCELYNLYTLRLFECRSLEKLPDNMEKLISLKHLYVDLCDKLEYLPKGIRRLKKLKTIDVCVVVCGEDEDRAALQLGDLRVLKLEGSLIIKLKGNVKDERELEKEQLWDMKKLFHLGINCKDVLYKQTRSTIEILNALQPHENMESLCISYHSGTTYSNWMMSLHNLRIIFLYEWSDCMFLPPLGKLPYLENLTLWNMENLEKIGGEFLGVVNDETSLKSSSSSFFPKLKQLEISFMDTLVDWEVGVEGWNKEDSEISIMPCLSYLQFRDCKGIKTLPDFLCKTPLQDLIIKGCPMLSERCEQSSGEEWPKISHIPNIKISSS